MYAETMSTSVQHLTICRISKAEDSDWGMIFTMHRFGLIDCKLRCDRKRFKQKLHPMWEFEINQR